MLFERHHLTALGGRQRIVEERLGPGEIVRFDTVEVTDRRIDESPGGILDRSVFALRDMRVDPSLLLRRERDRHAPKLAKMPAGRKGGIASKRAPPPRCDRERCQLCACRDATEYAFDHGLSDLAADSRHDNYV